MNSHKWIQIINLYWFWSTFLINIKKVLKLPKKASNVYFKTIDWQMENQLTPYKHSPLSPQPILKCHSWQTFRNKIIIFCLFLIFVATPFNFTKHGHNDEFVSVGSSSSSRHQLCVVKILLTSHVYPADIHPKQINWTNINSSQKLVQISMTDHSNYSNCNNTYSQTNWLDGWTDAWMMVCSFICLSTSYYLVHSRYATQNGPTVAICNRKKW